MSAKNKRNFRGFFWFLKVIVKGYFRTKFQPPTVSLSKVSVGGWGNFYPIPPFHRTSIKKPIQNKVNKRTSSQCYISEIVILNIKMNKVIARKVLTKTKEEKDDDPNDDVK